MGRKGVGKIQAENKSAEGASLEGSPKPKRPKKSLKPPPKKEEEDKKPPASLEDAEDLDQATAAIETLQKWHSSKKAHSLFDEEAALVNVCLTLKIAPTHIGVRVKTLHLPHPYHSPKSATICLFVKDLDRVKHDPDVDKDARIFAEYLAVEKGVEPGTIAEIISLRQLKREYQSYEAKRRLASAYDIFLVDERVLREFYRNLGRTFQTRKALPTPINLVEGNVAARIQAAWSATNLQLRRGAHRLSFKLGSLSQPLEHLRQNWLSVKAQLETSLPGSFANVRSVYASLQGSPNLPLYVDYAGKEEVRMPEPKPEPEPVEGVLSTLDPSLMLGAVSVRVWPNGRVALLNEAGDEVPLPPEFNTQRPDEILMAEQAPQIRPNLRERRRGATRKANKAAAARGSLIHSVMKKRRERRLSKPAK